MIGRIPQHLQQVFVRNLIFGVEDSLVSTVGLLAGIAVGDVPPHTILLTGVVYIAVEALSMAVGSFLSEESVTEMEEKRPGVSVAFWGALVMFASFIIAGFVPLAPYLLVGGGYALPASVIVSLVVLFGLGFAHGRMVKANSWSRALRMMLLGGGAILLGIGVSRLFGIA